MLSQLALIGMLAVAKPSAPPSDADLYRAIWNDLFLNAMIDNGEQLASRWYNAGASKPGSSDLHIRGLDCKSGKRDYRCTFKLVRDGGTHAIGGEMAPDKLDCAATLVLQEEDGDMRWTVRHLPPPPRGGHSRTSMACKLAT